MRISDWSSDVCSYDLKPATAVPIRPSGKPENLLRRRIDQITHHHDLSRTRGHQALGGSRRERGAPLQGPRRALTVGCRYHDRTGAGRDRELGSDLRDDLSQQLNIHDQIVHVACSIVIEHATTPGVRTETTCQVS